MIIVDTIVTLAVGLEAIAHGQPNDLEFLKSAREGPGRDGKQGVGDCGDCAAIIDAVGKVRYALLVQEGTPSRLAFTSQRP